MRKREISEIVSKGLEKKEKDRKKEGLEPGIERKRQGM